MLRNRLDQNLAQQRQTAAKDDHLRMTQVNHVGKPECQVLRGFIQNPERQWICSLDRFEKVARFPSGTLPGALTEFRQGGIWFLPDGAPNSLSRAPIWTNSRRRLQCIRMRSFGNSRTR